jgi:hypothetical protein
MEGALLKMDADAIVLVALDSRTPVFLAFQSRAIWFVAGTGRSAESALKCILNIEQGAWMSDNCGSIASVGERLNGRDARD